MKVYRVIFIFICHLATIAFAKENYEDYWKTINQDLITRDCIGCTYADNPVHKDECGIVSCEKVCYDRSGINIGDERCIKIWDWVKNDARKLLRIRADLDAESLCPELSKKCLSEDEKSLAKMKSARDNLRNVTDDIKINLKEYYAHIQNKLDKEIQVKASEIARVNGKDGYVSSVQAKIKSKECQIYRLEKSICQKSYMSAVADSALSAENEVTKKTGVINKVGRYQIGKMRIIHGTDQILKLKTRYKQLTSKEWDAKSCQPTDGGDGYGEEVKICGCEQEIGSENDCPRGKNGSYLD